MTLKDGIGRAVIGIYSRWPDPRTEMDVHTPGRILGVNWIDTALNNSLSFHDKLVKKQEPYDKREKRTTGRMSCSSGVAAFLPAEYGNFYLW